MTTNEVELYLKQLKREYRMNKILNVLPFILTGINILAVLIFLIGGI